jgi:hypothetical protein
MRAFMLIGTTLGAAVLAVWGGGTRAEEFSARLDGFQEIGSLTGPTGAVLSNATGTLHLDLDRNKQKVTYKLTYTDVGTTSPQLGMVSQAHIHFGKNHNAGQVMVFFCTNLTPPPAGVPQPQPCPVKSGTVMGEWTGADVLQQTSQNIALHDFDALADALTFDTAYANIHTVPLMGATNTAFPAGEIRGQIHKGGLGDKHDDHDDHDDHGHK